MRIVIAPDSFGGTLSACEAAAAIAEGWQRRRPEDQVVAIPLSDGGEGLTDVLGGGEDVWLTSEVSGPMGHPVDAAMLLRDDGSAVIESARACGLHLVPPHDPNPLLATTYGVGELIEAARDAGATRIIIGLGGSATVDGGAGALTGLGFRLTVADGSGLKVGGGDLGRIARIDRGWAADGWDGIDIELLTDVRAPLIDAARVFGPQKGATDEMIETLEKSMARWQEVALRDLDHDADPDEPGAGAAGGLGFGLAAGLGATYRDGAATVADLQGLDELLDAANIVITGEGRIDDTTADGKVLSEVLRRAKERAVRVLAVAGQAQVWPEGVADLEESAPDGPGADPAAEVADAAERLAARVD